MVLEGKTIAFEFGVSVLAFYLHVVTVDVSHTIESVDVVYPVVIAVKTRGR